MKTLNLIISLMLMILMTSVTSATPQTFIETLDSIELSKWEQFKALNVHLERGQDFNHLLAPYETENGIVYDLVKLPNGTTYQVRQNDTFWQIFEDHVLDKFEANKDVLSDDSLDHLVDSVAVISNNAIQSWNSPVRTTTPEDVNLDLGFDLNCDLDSLLSELGMIGFTPALTDIFLQVDSAYASTVTLSDRVADGPSQTTSDSVQSEKITISDSLQNVAIFYSSPMDQLQGEFAKFFHGRSILFKAGGIFAGSMALIAFIILGLLAFIAGIAVLDWFGSKRLILSPNVGQDEFKRESFWKLYRKHLIHELEEFKRFVKRSKDRFYKKEPDNRILFP